MNWIEQLLTAFLKWINGLAQTDRTANETKPDPALRADLLRRIDDHERRMRDQGPPGAPRNAGEAGGAGEGPGVRP